MKRIWPFTHIGLKLLALLLACLLWFAVSGEETVERALRVPLELQQFPSGLELRGDWPGFVDVRVRGASGVLSRISAGDVVAVLDLRSARVGARIFQLTPDQVRAPFGVQPVQITPSTIGLTFERAKVKKVPVKPVLEGEPAPGFVVGTVSVDPPAVEVVGPESLVDRATQAITEPVSIAGARQAVTEDVTVGFLESSLRLATPQPATVTVQIVPGPAERTIADLPVHLRNLGASLTAQAVPVAVTVTVRGSRRSLNLVAPSSLTAYVDLDRLGAGEYTLNVQVETTQDVGIVRIEPGTVKVSLVAN